MDLKLDDGLKTLIEQGKEKGYLTFSQVNEFLPDDAVNPEKLDQLLLVLEESGRAPTADAPDAVVTIFSDDLRVQTLALGARLRAAGLAIDVYPGTGKLKAQFKYADSKRARFCLVLGPDEAAQGVVKLKEMSTGTETTVPIDEAPARIRG